MKLLTPAFGLVILAALSGLAIVPSRIALAEDVRTVKVDEDKLTLEVPNSWKDQPVATRMRLKQFEIPKAEGDEDVGELAIFPPFGGSREDNIKRWVNQFESQGRTMKTTEGKTEKAAYVLVDLSGTYKKPIGPPMAQQTKSVEGYRMLAVIYSPTAGGNYFFKLTGPEKTVTAAAEKFRASFGTKAENEKEWKLAE